MRFLLDAALLSDPRTRTLTREQLGATPGPARGFSGGMPAGRIRLGLAALVALVVLAPSADGEAAQVRGACADDRRGAAADVRRLRGAADGRRWDHARSATGSRGQRSKQARRVRLGVDRRHGRGERPSADDHAAVPLRHALLGGRRGRAGLFRRGVRVVPPRTAETRTAFGDFAAAAVRRYGPGGSFWDQHRALPYRPIETWQLWNEPNLSSFYRPGGRPERLRAPRAGGRRGGPQRGSRRGGAARGPHRDPDQSQADEHEARS